MCKKKDSDFCTELGVDPGKWSKRCPLPPPKHFEECLDTFINAYYEAKKGNISKSLKLLMETRSDDLRDWFVKHGQMSGHYYRVNGLQLSVPAPFDGKYEEKKKPSRTLERQVFTRDGYRCRYCQTRVLDFKVLQKFEKLVGRSNFRASAETNDLRHGVTFFFRATADHVVPLTRGGQTTLENLVTACWNCNIGKLNALLSQMGIEDPRKHPTEAKLKWDGMLSDD
jgi:5-methylcytosine-specific restriction endonuclease McrA